MSQNSNHSQQPFPESVTTVPIDSIPEAVIITDMAFKVIAWNNAAEQLYGWTASEAIGRSVPDMLRSEFLDTDTQAAMSEIMQTGRWQGKARSYRKDGTQVDTVGSVKLEYDAAGRPIRSVALNRALSSEESRRLSRGLHDQQFKTLVVNAPDIIARFDRELRCLYVNPAASKYTIQPLEHVVGQTLSQLGVADYVVELVRNVADIVYKTGNGQQSEFAIPMNDGIRHFLARVEPEFDGEQVATLLVIGRDITDLKQAEGKLRQQASALEASHEILEQRVADRTKDLVAAVESEKQSRLFAELLQVANEALASPVELEDVLSTILDCVAELVPYDSACIMLIDENNRFVPMALRGYENWIEPKQFVEFISNTEFAPVRFEEILQGEIVFVEDTVRDPAWVAYPETTYIRSWLGVPLLTGGKVIGLYSIDQAKPNGFTEMHKSLAAAFAPQAGAAIANAQHHAREVERAAQFERIATESTTELRQQYRRQSSLIGLNLAAIGREDISRLLERIAQIAQDLLPASGGASVILWDNEQQQFVVSAASGIAIRGDGAARRVRRTGGATRRITETGQPIFVSDVADDPFGANPMLIERGLQAYAGVPLIWESQTLGVLYALCTTKRDFSETDADFLQDLANRAAAIIGKMHLDNALARANAQLLRSVRLKDEFMANMSHELRTPLDAIIARAELLQDGLYGPVGEAQRRPLQVMQSSAEHLLQLINDILDVSRIEAGTINLRPTQIDVKTICDACMQFVQERALTKRVRLQTQIDPDISWLIADELRLRQILVNLLTNAVKFTPSDGQVGLDVTKDDEQGMIRFAVWDTGIGIAENDLDKLFERFTQLSSGLTRSYEGVGLGLSLVKRLAQLHGGYVTVESKVGQGSRFTVGLPLESDIVIDKVLPVDHFSAETTQSSRGAAILVVDDNAESLELRNEYLSMLGYQVSLATDGEQAFSKAIAERPDLIIMDIQMPGMDGLTAIREIRTQHMLKRVPIIVQTALAMPGDEERCLQAGAQVYLSKPTSIQLLINEIERLLEQQYAL